MVETSLAPGPTVCVGSLGLQFLGLERDSSGAEVYEVLFRPVDSAPWRAGRLSHTGGDSWALEGEGASREPLGLGPPDAVFAVALGQPALALETVARVAPHWPAALHGRLAGRGASGACTIAFDGRWFLARLTDSAIDRPLVLPGAAGKLGLRWLERAREVVAEAAAPGGEATSLIELLQRGLGAAGAGWRGEGRLIGESTWGDLAQVGADVAEGCRAAQGAGPLSVVFDPHEALGLGFAPERPSAEVAAGGEPARGASAGTGLEVGEVEPGGAAEVAGVVEGMVATRLSSPDLALHVDGVGLPFEEILHAIDARRAAGARLAITFDTAAPLTHWYAVEMPAASMLAALDVSAAGAAGIEPDDSELGRALDALCGGGLLWQEPIPRVFLGAAGSVTCAHVDICPQVQLAHGLLGTKVLGVASHEATARLAAEHDGEEGPTHLPTDRPLSPEQEALLSDGDVALILLQPGDLAVFHSGALHFASNGADGLAGALYHGVITPAALPRLRAAAAAPGGSGPDGDDAYSEHLFAADLLKLVESR